MISASNDPTENRAADVIPSEIDICMAAMFNVPNGNEPRKLISMPIKKILVNRTVRMYKLTGKINKRVALN